MTHLFARQSAKSSARSRRPSIAGRLEMLETRTLLSAITSYQVDDIVQPGGSAVDPAGNLWVADHLMGVVKITKSGGAVTDTVFAAGPAPQSVAYDPVNGHIYVANDGGPIKELGLDGQPINTFSAPNPDDAPLNIAVASDGSIWFTTHGNFAADTNQTYTADIGRMDLAGNFTTTLIPVSNTTAESISAAPDGSVWIGTTGTDNPVTSGVSYLGRATAGAGGAINLTMYNVPHNVGGINSIAVAADNSVWYGLDANANSSPARAAVTESIGHATLTGGTLSVTEFALPKQSGEGIVAPATLAIDTVGNLWFTTLDSIDTLNTSTGDFTRMNPNNPGAVRNSLAVSSTDVWVQYSGGNFNLENVDLTNFSPPLAAVSPDIAATAGQTFSGPVAVFVSSDAGSFNYTINYGNGTTQIGTVANDPSGMYTINGSTSYASVGTYQTSVIITSAAGDLITVNGQATVTNVVTTPLISAGVNLQAQRGVALAPNVSGVSNVVVAQFSGPPSSYTATINWGDSTSTVGQIVSLGSNQYYVELPTGTSKSYAVVGTYNVSVVIGDGTQSTTATSTATISSVPVVASQNLVLQPLLGKIVLTTVATFTADTISSASWFRATINWGDGTQSVGLVVRTSAGHYAIIGLHIYSKKGTYAVKTSIVDSVDAESALATATITIK